MACQECRGSGEILLLFSYVPCKCGRSRFMSTSSRPNKLTYPGLSGVTVDFRMLGKRPYSTTANYRKALIAQGCDCTNVNDGLIAKIAREHKKRLAC